MPGFDVLGREAELAAVDEFLALAASGPAGLLLAGEAGIGKTTIWRTAVERAGRRVLLARPAPAESRLTYVGLADLLDGIDDAVVDRLPAPQRRALEAGLLRADPSGPAIDQRVVCTAFLSVLRALAASGPVLVAVDDLQWLDPASRRVLDFAARRLVAEPVGILATLRGDPSAAPAGTRVVRVDRLDSDTLRRIVGPVVPRPTLVRIVEAADGNPMLAIEMARAAAGRPDDLTGALPVPAELRTLLVGRTSRLPDDTRYALLLATQSATAPPPADLARLRPAERAGVVMLDGGQVRFTHPLFASAIYRSAPRWLRRQAHRELAGRAGQAEDRARHLALGADRPSAAVADALTSAAAQIRVRGAPDAAAELLELAVAATPADQPEARLDRLAAAAESHFHAGDRGRARTLAEEVAAAAGPGPVTGRAHRLLGLISSHEDSYEEAVRLLRAARDDLRDDPLVVDVLLNLAHALVSRSDMPGAAIVAGSALTEARRFGDRALEADALAVAAITDLFTGVAPDWARLDEAVRLEDRDRASAAPIRPSGIAGTVNLYCDRLGPAREHLTGLRRRMIDRGEESDLPFLSFHLAMLERLAGDLPAALRYADEGYQLARLLGSDHLSLLCVGERCFARAMSGEVAAARDDSREALALAARTGYPAGVGLAHAATGFLELSVGNATAAVAALDLTAGTVERLGYCHPVLAFYLPDAIEALIATGQPARAGTLVGPLRRAGEAAGRPNVVAVAGRCEAMLLAHRREPEAALDAVAAALAADPGAHLPLDRARLLLLKGQILRRVRRRKLAAEALRESLAAFTGIGAVLWAGKAEAELDRVGRRTVATAQLTATEDRMAALAATGLTNREIADRTFVTPKTVEANLARVYRKLGIHSRAELGARMGGGAHNP